MLIKKSILIIILIILGFILLKIFYMSYLSVYGACNNVVPEGYVVSGSVTQEEVNDSIVNVVRLKSFKTSTLKHEYCHVNQNIDKRNSYCNLKHYINEIECYSSEYIPNFLYKSIYGYYSNLQNYL